MTETKCPQCGCLLTRTSLEDHLNRCPINARRVDDGSREARKSKESALALERLKFIDMITACKTSLDVALAKVAKATRAGVKADAPIAEARRACQDLLNVIGFLSQVGGPERKSRRKMVEAKSHVAVSRSDSNVGIWLSPQGQTRKPGSHRAH